jgi:hypothetical protein
MRADYMSYHHALRYVAGKDPKNTAVSAHSALTLCGDLLGCILSDTMFT